MKRTAPALFRIVQERPKGKVRFSHRYWVIWEWNDELGQYEYYLFTLNQTRAFALLDEVLERRGHAHRHVMEAPC